MLTCVLHHHIGKSGPFEDGLDVATDLEIYEGHLKILDRDYDIIDLDTLLDGKLPRKPLLLTFDDAFQSVYDIARDILAPQNLPSVYFINPELVDQRETSLDAIVAWACSVASMSEVAATLDIQPASSAGTIVVDHLNAMSASQRSALRKKLIATFGPCDLTDQAAILTKEDVRNLKSYGVAVGNHTASHVHCRALTNAELTSQIADSKTNLEEMSDQQVRSFSVPYGHENDLTPEVLDCLRVTGHEAIFLVHARANLRRPASDIWYRVSLRNLPPNRIKRELTVKPLLRTLKHAVTSQ